MRIVSNHLTIYRRQGDFLWELVFEQVRSTIGFPAREQIYDRTELVVYRSMRVIIFEIREALK